MFQADGCNTCHAAGTTSTLSYDSLIRFGYADGVFAYQTIQLFLDLAHLNDGPALGGHGGLSAADQQLVLNWLLLEQSERY